MAKRKNNVVEKNQAKQAQANHPGREIVFNPPDENTPGYFHRLKSQMEIQLVLEDKTGAYTPQQKMGAIDKMVDLVLPYIVEPSDPEEARELLIGPNGLSEKRFKELMGVSDDPLSQSGNGTA